MEYAFIQWLIGDVLIPAVIIGSSLITGFFAGRFYEYRKLKKAGKNADKNIVAGNPYNINKK